jgi:Ser/Thr protein kinase RdoA (MazF antagonist)
VILKFYRAERWTDEQILEEHAFAQELVEHEISVSCPRVCGWGNVTSRLGPTVFGIQASRRLSARAR